MKKISRAGWPGVGSSGTGEGSVTGPCEHGTEAFGSIQCGYFLSSSRLVASQGLCSVESFNTI